MSEHVETPSLRPREPQISQVPGRTEVNRRTVADVIGRQTTIEIWLRKDGHTDCLLTLDKKGAESLAADLQRAAAHLERNRRVIESAPGFYGEVEDDG